MKLWERSEWERNNIETALYVSVYPRLSRLYIDSQDLWAGYIEFRCGRILVSYNYVTRSTLWEYCDASTSILLMSWNPFSIRQYNLELLKIPEGAPGQGLVDNNYFQSIFV